MNELNEKTVDALAVLESCETNTILRKKMGKIVFFLLFYGRRISEKKRDKMVYMHAILRHLADEGKVTQGHIKGELIFVQGITAFSDELFRQAWTSVQALVGNKLMG